MKFQMTLTAEPPVSPHYEASDITEAMIIDERIKDFMDVVFISES